MVWVLILLLAALFRGMGDAFRKRALAFESILDFIGSFAIVQFIFALPVLFFRIDFSIAPNILLMVIILDIMVLLSAFFVAACYKREEVSTVTPLMNLSPIFLLVLSFFLLSEMPSFVQIVGVLVIIIGGYVLTIKNFRNWYHPFTEINHRHLFYMVVIWFIASFLSILNKVILFSVSAYTLFFWSNMVYTFLTILLLAFSGRLKNSIKVLKRHFFVFALPAIFLNLAVFSFYVALAIPAVMVSLAIPILRFASVITVFVGGRMYHEHNLFHKVIASAIMIIGIFLIALF